MRNDLNLPRIYWDASPIIEYFRGEQDRMRHLEVLIENSRKKHQLVTLVNTRVEVGAALRNLIPNFDSRTATRISEFWDSQTVLFVDCFSSVAKKAEKLVDEAMSQGWRLHPTDAIYLAAADHLQAREFHSYRADQLKKFEILTSTPLIITEPTVNNPLLLAGASR